MVHSKNTRQHGFTLIELVVVIVILGILAAFAIPRFINISADARVSAVNGLAGSLRSTAALLHGMSLAKGLGPAVSVPVEGVNVTMAEHYPTADAAGIVAAMNNLDGFISEVPPVAGVPANSIRFTPVSKVVAGVGDANCSVVYTGAPAGGAASVSQSVGVC